MTTIRRPYSGFSFLFFYTVVTINGFDNFKYPLIDFLYLFQEKFKPFLPE